MSQTRWLIIGVGNCHRAVADACSALFENLESRRLLATVDWISTTSGSWDVASNWSTDTVPGAGDDVVINVLGRSPDRDDQLERRIGKQHYGR